MGAIVIYVIVLAFGVAAVGGIFLLLGEHLRRPSSRFSCLNVAGAVLLVLCAPIILPILYFIVASLVMSIYEILRLLFGFK